MFSDYHWTDIFLGVVCATVFLWPITSKMLPNNYDNWEGRGILLAVMIALVLVTAFCFVRYVIHSL